MGKNCQEVARTEIHPRTGGRDARNLVVVSPGPIT